MAMMRKLKLQKSSELPLTNDDHNNPKVIIDEL